MMEETQVMIAPVVERMRKLGQKTSPLKAFTSAENGRRCERYVITEEMLQNRRKAQQARRERERLAKSGNFPD